MNEADRQAMLGRVSDALKRALPDALACYVYGSFARGDERGDSDVDIGVLLPPRAFLPDKLSLIAQLAKIAAREIDLVDLRQANLDLVHALLREGRALFVTDADAVLTWEAERMTDYALFNPRRKDIVADFLQKPLREPS